MGLDITAYEKVSLIHKSDGTGWCEEHEDLAPGSLYNISGMHKPAVTEWEYVDDDNVVHYGCFESTGRVHGFRAGSYSGYNQWREQLCKAALGMTTNQLWNAPMEGPFVELINFPDNEGVIGPAMCAKLAKDFLENREKISKLVEAKPAWFMEKYDCWARAFGMASVAGCVEFH